MSETISVVMQSPGPGLLSRDLEHHVPLGVLGYYTTGLCLCKARGHMSYCSASSHTVRSNDERLACMLNRRADLKLLPKPGYIVLNFNKHFFY